MRPKPVLPIRSELATLVGIAPRRPGIRSELPTLNGIGEDSQPGAPAAPEVPILEPISSRVPTLATSAGAMFDSPRPSAHMMELFRAPAIETAPHPAIDRAGFPLWVVMVPAATLGAALAALLL